MSVATAVYERLSEDSTLTALLATPESVFQHFAPEEAKDPYVLFNLHSGVQTWSFRNFYRNQLWVVKGICRGGDSTPAEQINARLETLLDDAPLAIGEHLIYWRRENDINYGEIDGGTLVSHCGGLYRAYTEPEGQ